MSRIPTYNPPIKKVKDLLSGGNVAYTFKEKQQIFDKLKGSFNEGTFSRRVIKYVANGCQDLESGISILVDLANDAECERKNI